MGWVTKVMFPPADCRRRRPLDDDEEVGGKISRRMILEVTDALLCD